MAITITIADGLSQDELTADFRIPVTVTDVTPDGPTSFTVDVLYDPAVIDITGATATGVTSGESLTVDTDFGSTGDTIRVTWSGSALSGSGTLFELNVDAVAIGNSTLVLETAEFDGGTITTTSEDGDIDIISRTPSFQYTGVDGTYNETGTGSTPSFTYTAIDGFTVLTDFFDTYDDGDEPTNNWTNQWGGTLPSAEWDDEKLGGKVLQYDEAGTAERLFSLDSITSEADVEIVVGFEYENVVQAGNRIYARGGGTSSTKDGYGVYLDPTEIGLFKYDNNSPTIITTAAVALSNNVNYICRFRVSGTDIKAKVWVQGEAEPAWQVTTTDSALTTGLVGLGISDQLSNVKYDYFRVGVDVPEETVPLPFDEVALRTYTDFSEATALEDWYVIAAAADESMTIEDDGTAAGGKVLRLERTVANTDSSVYNYAPAQHQNDQDMFIRWKSSTVSAGMQPTFWLHADPEPGNFNGYYLEFLDGGTIRIIEVTDNSFSTIVTGTFARTADTWYRTRFRAVDGVIRARIWADTDDEPTTWNLSVADTTRTGGGMSVGMFFPSADTGSLDFDILSIGSFNNCGLEVPESSLPDKGLILTSANDDSFRVCDEDGNNFHTIGFVDSQGIRAAAFDPVNEKFYITGETGDRLFVFDRYGKYPRVYNDAVLVSKDGIWGVSVNQGANEVYYQSNVLDDLFKADLDDGGNESTLKADAGTQHTGVFYDDVDDKVYYSGNGSHRRLSPDGTGDEEMIAQTDAIDVVADGTYFWFTASGQTDVKRRDVATKGNEITLYSDLSDPQGLALDKAGLKVYAADAGTDVIRKSDYDGSNPSDIITSFDNTRALEFYNFTITYGVGTTGSFSYDGVDGFGQLSAVPADTPDFSYDGVDGSATFGEYAAPAEVPSYTYEGVAATSNIVSGFANPNVSYQYQGVDGVGILSDVSVTFQSPIQEREYTQFTFDVNVTDLTGLNVTSFECVIAYDSTKLSAISANPAGITSGKSLTVNVSTPGEISVAFADVSALSGSGVLFEVEVLALDITPPDEVTPITWTSFSFNEGTPSDQTTDGNVQILENPGVTPSFSYVGVDSNLDIVGVTASFSYQGVDGNPGSNATLGYALPTPPVVYSVPDPSFVIGNIIGIADTPSYTYDAQDGTVTVPSLTGVADTPSIVYTVITPSGITVGVGTTPSITYVAQNATEETFGTPTHVKVESFNAYSAHVYIRPKMFDGLIHKDETVEFQAILRDSDDQLVTLPSFTYFFVRLPDGTVEGPFQASVGSTGHYTYDYVPTKNGVYWVRFADPSSDVIEEKRFAVVESRVRL